MTDNTARDQEIWEKYTLGGKGIRALGDEYGVSFQRISAILKAKREEAPEQDRSEIVALRREQIAAGIEALMPGVSRGSSDAIKAWKILTERESKYLGLDAAEKVEISGGVRYEIAGLDDDD
jgi:hypothetical protein